MHELKLLAKARTEGKQCCGAVQVSYTKKLNRVYMLSQGAMSPFSRIGQQDFHAREAYTTGVHIVRGPMLYMFK